MTATDVQQRDDEEQVTASAPAPPAATAPAAPGFRRVLALVLGLALVTSVGVCVWLLAGRRGEADDLQQQREQVMAQTRQFLLRMGTYGPDLLDDRGAMPAYRERVGEVITPKFKASFEKEAGVAEQLVAQSRAARVAEVFATGVSDLDPDSATALVAGTFTDTYVVKGDQIEGEPVPFRIEVSLVRIDDAWLVDDFTPLTGTDESPGVQP